MFWRHFYTGIDSLSSCSIEENKAEEKKTKIRGHLNRAISRRNRKENKRGMRWIWVKKCQRENVKRKYSSRFNSIALYYGCRAEENDGEWKTHTHTRIVELVECFHAPPKPFNFSHVLFCVLFSCCDYDAIRFPIQKQNKKKRANKQNTIKDDDSCCCCRAYGVRISRPAAGTNEYATYHIQQNKKQNEKKKKIKNRAAILLYFM